MAAGKDWKKVVYVLNRGGPIQDFEDGDKTIQNVSLLLSPKVLSF